MKKLLSVLLVLVLVVGALSLTALAADNEPVTTIEIGMNTVPTVEGSTLGQELTWTAPCAGELTITMVGTNWNFKINDGEVYTIANLPDAAKTVEVAKNDVVTLTVNTADASDAGVKFEAAFEHVGGCCEEFAIVVDAAEEIETKANVWYAVELVDGVIPSFEDNGGYIYNVKNTYWNLISHHNNKPLELVDAEKLVTFWTSKDTTVTFTYPVGHSVNPEVIESLDNQIVHNFNTNDPAYYFSWTATCNGTLTFTMDNTGDWQRWMYSIDGGKTYAWDDEEVTLVQTIDVVAGQEVIIALSKAVGNYGSEEFTLSFEHANPGYCQLCINNILRPMQPQINLAGRGFTKFDKDGWNYFKAAGKDTTAVFENVIRVIYNDHIYWADEDGVVTITGLTGVMGAMDVFAVQIDVNNDSVAPLATLTYYEGHMNNPQDMFLGENVTNDNVNMEVGHFYTFTAPYSGTLTLTGDAANSTTGWAFVVDGEIFDPWDGGETVEIELKQGETITIEVYGNNLTQEDWDNWVAAPTGKVTFNATLTPAAKLTEYNFTLGGLLGLNLKADLGEDVNTNEGWYFVKITIGEDLYFIVLENGVATLNIEAHRLVEDVNIELYFGNHRDRMPDVLVGEYTVQLEKYVEWVNNAYGEKSPEAKMVNAMYDYCVSAAIYNGNTELTAPDFSGAAAPKFDADRDVAKKTGELTGVMYNLLLEEAVTIQFKIPVAYADYYTLCETAEEGVYEWKKIKDVCELDGGYYVDKSDLILPEDYAETWMIAITDDNTKAATVENAIATYSVNALAYIKNHLDDAKVGNLCKALYYYYEAVYAYNNPVDPEI